MASFEEFRDKLTGQRLAASRPDSTESDNSGVTQPLVTARRSAEANQQDHDYDRA